MSGSSRDQQVGVVDQCRGQLDSLPHPFGVGTYPFGVFRIQIDICQTLEGLARWVGNSVGLACKFYELIGRETVQKSFLLRCESNAAAYVAVFASILTENPHRAPRRGREAAQDAKQRRLAQLRSVPTERSRPVPP